MLFKVSLQSPTSSRRYSRRREGSARKTKIIAGMIVQIVSISWPSTRERDVSEFSIRERAA